MISLLLAVITMLMTPAVSALELDGVTSGNAAWTAESSAYATTTEIALTQRFSQDARLEIAGRLNADTTGTPRVLLSELRYEQTVTVTGFDIVTMELGRQPVSDATGLVQLPAVDAGTLTWQRPGFSLSAVGATTTLLAPEQSLVLTSTDATATDPEGLTGPTRHLAVLTLAFPEQIWRTNLAAQYLLQLDGRRFADPAAGEDLLDAQYATGTVSLPLSRALFATASVVGSYARYEVAGSGGTDIVSLLASGSLRGYTELPTRPSGTVRAVYASGADQPNELPAVNAGAGTDRSSAFPPGPFQLSWTLAPLPLQNVVAVAAEGSLLPLEASGLPWLEDTRLTMRAQGLAKPGPGASGVAGLVSPEATGWYGAELDAELLLKPFGDLEISGSGAIFLPAQSAIGGVFAAQVEQRWRMTIGATLRW